MEKSMSEKDDDVTDVEFYEVPDKFTEETDQTKTEERLLDLMRPINKQIEECKTRSDILLLASGMMHTARDLFICEIGADAAKTLFSNLKFKDPVEDEPQVH